MKTKALGLSLVFLLGCGTDDSGELDPASSCYVPSAEVITSATGSAYIFNPDPMVSSGDTTLSPTSLALDNYKTQVELANLGGRGILQGTYVDVRNGSVCEEGFGAYKEDNQFLYSHGQSEFQEAMTYYHGDNYRSQIVAAGYNQPEAPLQVIAHCINEDNAFFIRARTESGELIEKVCLGDSVATPSASYADDAAVVIHEIQHATTVDTYSLTTELNQFWYDEAGGLNEAISDFMSLMYLEPTDESFDARLFGRWSLGTFIPGLIGYRGAHKCPAYDSAYPDCTNFVSGAAGFSADNNTISYTYPDGLGWPYANNFKAPAFVSSAFDLYLGQEEIHNAGIVMVGALWDAYQAVKANHGSASTAKSLMTKAILEAITHLPKPTAAARSPVTYRGFASDVLTWGAQQGMSSADISAVQTAFTNRGLYGGSTLSGSWAAVGDGSSENAGVKVIDNPNLLIQWFAGVGADPDLVTQGVATGMNEKLDAGDVAAIWFDIKNISNLTAGGLTLNVTSLSPYVKFMDNTVNLGVVSDYVAQIMYFKVNGTDIVSALSSANSTYNVDIANSYFKTNKNFSSKFYTALFVKVDANKPSDATSVTFEVTVTPTNGEAQTLNFNVDLL